MDCLDIAFETFTKTATRLELLPTYHIYDTQEYAEFRNYIEGKLINGFANQAWIDDIINWKTEGKIVSRIRVVPHQQTDYYKYESSWCYPKNIAAGENIDFIPETTYQEISRQFGINDDFWIFDEKIVIILRYNSSFEFEEAIQIEDEQVKSKYLEFYNSIKEVATK